MVYRDSRQENVGLFFYDLRFNSFEKANEAKLILEPFASYCWSPKRQFVSKTTGIFPFRQKVMQEYWDIYAFSKHAVLEEIGYRSSCFVEKAKLDITVQLQKEQWYERTENSHTIFPRTMPLLVTTEGIAEVFLEKEQKHFNHLLRELSLDLMQDKVYPFVRDYSPPWYGYLTQGIIGSPLGLISLLRKYEQEGVIEEPLLFFPHAVCGWKEYKSNVHDLSDTSYRKN